MMDPAKSAHTENVEIVRDRVHIILTDGTIQFVQPANGIVFGAVFHGKGRVQADPPNPIEAQQLFLFTKQPKLDMPFTDATFSSTDGLLEEVAKQVKWQGTGPTADELYAKRQQEREDLGAEYLPRLFKSVMSGDRKRTGYFLADLKTNDKGWVEVRDDAMQIEEIRVGRWAEVSIGRIPDTWMHFPANERDPRHAYDDPAARQDFLIPNYKIATSVADNAELNATTEATVQPRYSGEAVLLFFQFARKQRQRWPRSYPRISPGSGTKGPKSILWRILGSDAGSSHAGRTERTSYFPVWRETSCQESR
jgi:hypothetical protein